MSETRDQQTARLRITLRHLEVFVAVARAGSTRAAAERVARSQSAASNALHDLEDALGVGLFDRVGRRLVINESGRTLLPYAATLLDHAGGIQGLFAGGHTSVLRVGASFTIGEYLLPERLALWKLQHEESRVLLRIGNTSEVIDAVASFDVDVGFIEGAQTHPDLLVRDWLTDELVLFTGPSHALAGASVSVRDLRSASWIMRELGSGTREAADRWLMEQLGHLKIEFELGSSEAIKRLVASGLGIGCLSRYAVAEAFQQGWLVPLRTRLPRAVRRLALVTHHSKHLGPGMAAFVEHCTMQSKA